MNPPRRRVATVLAVVFLVALSATPTVSTQVGHQLDQSAVGEPGGGLTVGDPVTNFSAVHESGVTGEGVRVGVIGREFMPGHSTVATHVAGSRRFAGGPVLERGSGAHDTAVAEIVARTAPDADLYLASVGSHPTPGEYAAAVEWLLARDVDVIVDAASYFPRSGTAAERMNAVASRATARGVVFVTSAGNYADRHWSGTASGEGWVTFEQGVQANPLGNGSVAGKVSLRLYWHSGADYDLYLYRYRSNAPDQVVAKSTARQSGAGDHAEAIDVRLPEGQYYVAVYGAANASGKTSLDLFAPAQQLKYTVADGSMVAPATATNVITVGALNPGSGRLRSYSSRSAALDVTAPDGAYTSAGVLYGTSAAAPLVAGTAALMEARHGELTPAEAERILQSTAVRAGGRLRVDPAAAVSAAADAAGTDSTLVVPEQGANDQGTNAAADGTTANGTDTSASTPTPTSSLSPASA